MDEPAMRIGEAARRSGIAPATIRVWQRRYRLLAPVRSEGGQRLFSERDVRALVAVRRRVESGWSLSAAAASVAEGQDEYGPDPNVEPTDALGELPADPVMLLAVHDAARALLRAPSPADVIAVLVELVYHLGGSVGPAVRQSDDVIPVDISLGEINPLVPRAQQFSIARLRLETVLPGLVEDARRMVALLRAAGR